MPQGEGITPDPSVSKLLWMGVHLLMSLGGWQGCTSFYFSSWKLKRGETWCRPSSSRGLCSNLANALATELNQGAGWTQCCVQTQCDLTRPCRGKALFLVSLSLFMAQARELLSHYINMFMHLCFSEA